MMRRPPHPSLQIHPECLAICVFALLQPVFPNRGPWSVLRGTSGGSAMDHVYLE